MCKTKQSILTLLLALCLMLGLVPCAQAAETVEQPIQLWLDGRQIQSDVEPEITNSRTMIPIRTLAEKLGAQVEWVAEDRKVILTRAGVTVTMTVDKTTAYINDVPFEMDVAPYIKDNRTLLPARYVAEFFDQTVTWDGAERRVDVVENKSVVGASNLEAWAIPMGAMLTRMNYGRIQGFGGDGRAVPMLYSTTGGSSPIMTMAEYAREVLSDSWSINSREELVNTVCTMTFYGHNANFQLTAGMLAALTAEEYEQMVAEAEGMDAYMLPYTKALHEKWGRKGILCWDLFRMSNLVQWGYVGGYLTYAESLALLEPAATLLKEKFSSWDEAYENYLDGYHWWARENVLNADVWQTYRGRTYISLRDGEKTAGYFDDALFGQEIVPVPTEAWQDLYDQLTAEEE